MSQLHRRQTRAQFRKSPRWKRLVRHISQRSDRAVRTPQDRHGRLQMVGSRVGSSTDMGTDTETDMGTGSGTDTGLGTARHGHEDIVQ